jgi:outer membrane protein assembly factor BamB
VAAVVVQWLAWVVVPRVAPAAGGTALLVGVAAGLAVLLWWLLFSRAPWLERVGAVLLMVGAVMATRRVVHASIANGMMGMMLPLHAIPALSLALVAGLVASRRASSIRRRAMVAGAILLACGAFTLLRTGGITGEAVSDLHWRWSETPEERLLARAADEPAAPPTGRVAPTPPRESPAARRGVEPAAVAPAPAAPPHPGPPPPAGDSPAQALPSSPPPAGAEWPGFRGPARDGVTRGERIATDWTSSPPVELWRRPVGPGWSSFSVQGDRFYTQEQRGEDEVVSCYRTATGEPVWRHRDPARFWESNAGAGPRATPTLSGGRVYTLGGTGIVNALEAADGSPVWSRNAATDTGTEVPYWGFAGSPLVVADLVIVAAAGTLVAYDIATGRPRWVGPKGGGGYSSPHRATIGGVAQVLLLSGAGAIGVAPADGTVLWEHRWPGDGIVQPALTADGGVLIGTGSGLGAAPGVRRVAVGHGPAGWTVQERWTSTGLKPYYNDFVVHQGHAFGFDGSILACIDLQDGRRRWKGGRYGHGQLVLLPDQDLLLVLSEEGELALVGATPGGFTELARMPALPGKTWNHPVVVGDLLLARNAEQMAAFRLPAAAR